MIVVLLQQQRLTVFPGMVCNRQAEKLSRQTCSNQITVLLLNIRELKSPKSCKSNKLRAFSHFASSYNKLRRKFSPMYDVQQLSLDSDCQIKVKVKHLGTQMGAVYWMLTPLEYLCNK